MDHAANGEGTDEARPTSTIRASSSDGSLAEVWGTFLLVLVAAGGGVIGATAFGDELTLPMKALAPGMMVMGIIFFMGTISGAHLNPAVTLAFAVRGNFPGAACRATSWPRSSAPCWRRSS